uniref:Aspartic peptidase DDI1-type domain-containing protein n=1 Tax=Arundo donax TaxID=35708 RepID=A0A0A9HU01_ARUDO
MVHWSSKVLNVMVVDEENISEEEMPTEEIPDNDEENTQDEYLMHISEEDVKGITTKRTFTMPIKLGGKTGVALVDSGSSNTFVDLKFATKGSCTVVTNFLQKVTVAGGGIMQSGAHIPNCSFTIDKEQFLGNMKVLDL